MDQKLKDVLVKYGKQVMKPLIKTDSQNADFTPGSSGLSSSNIKDAIIESYNQAKSAASTAASAYNAANNAANEASNAVSAAVSAVFAKIYLDPDDVSGKTLIIDLD